MPGTGANIEVTGLDKLNRELAKRYTQMKNPRAVLSALAFAGEREILKNFRAGGRPEKWKESKRASRYVESKSGQKRKGQTLQNTGALRDSIKGWSDDTTAYVGVSDERVKKYGRIQNDGGVIQHPGGTMFIPLANGMIRFLKKDGSYPANARATAPHPITIPKREYLVFPPSSVKIFVDLVDRMMEGERS